MKTAELDYMEEEEEYLIRREEEHQPKLGSKSWSFPNVATSLKCPELRRYLPS